MTEKTRKPKTITMRRYAWEASSVVEIELVPDEYDEDGWDVRYRGRHIGSVGSYTGSLDRPAGRLRIPGKMRTLWHSKGPEKRQRSLFHFVSRAEAIRRLLPDSWEDQDLTRAENRKKRDEA